MTGFQDSVDVEVIEKAGALVVKSSKNDGYFKASIILLANACIRLEPSLFDICYFLSMAWEVLFLKRCHALITFRLCW